MSKACKQPLKISRTNSATSLQSLQSSRSSLSSMVSIDSAKSVDHKCYPAPVPPVADFGNARHDKKILCKASGTVTRVEDKRAEYPRHMNISYTDAKGQIGMCWRTRNDTLPAMGEKLYRIAEENRYRTYTARDIRAKRKAREKRILNDDTVSEVVIMEQGYLTSRTEAEIPPRKRQRVTYTEYYDVMRVKDDWKPGHCMVRTQSIFEQDWQHLRYDEGETVSPETHTYLEEWTTESGDRVSRLVTEAVVMRQKRNRRTELKAKLAKKAELVKEEDCRPQKPEEGLPTLEAKSSKVLFSLPTP